MNSTLKTIGCAIGAMLSAFYFISAHGAVNVTASRTYVVQETTLHASETSGQNVLIYTLGSQSNKFVVAKDGLERATIITPVTEPGTTNVIGYYIGTNVNAKVASLDLMSKVACLSPVYGQGEYSNTVIGYTLGYDTQKVAASEDWLSKVTEVKPIISSDDSPQRVVGYTIGTNAYVFASDKSAEVQQVKKVTGSTTNVVGYTIGGNTNNVFMSAEGVRQVVPNYPAVSNAAMRSSSSISDGTNIVDASRNVYRIKHNSWFVYKYGSNEYGSPIEISYRGSVSYSNITSSSVGTIDDFYVSDRYIDTNITVNGQSIISNVYIGVDGLTTNVVLTHKMRPDGVYPVIWSYQSAISNGVIYSFGNGARECEIKRKVDEEVSTEFVGVLALTNDVPNKVDSGRITDGTNIIDAAGNVYEIVTYAPWTRVSDGEEFVWNKQTSRWVGQNGEYIVEGGKNIFEFCSVSYGPIACGIAEGDLLSVSLHYFEGSGSGYYGSIVRESVYVYDPYGEPSLKGRLALTNELNLVVEPTTNAPPGAAADAKETGTALYTGFTEWHVVSIPVGLKFVSAEYEDNHWVVSLLDPSGIEENLFIDGPEDALTLTNRLYEYAFEISRRLVTPTKTSQIINDGDGTNQFATVNLIDASNETFSNAVLSVGIGIDTNTVAAINALVDAGDDLPIGGAATVVALLLAMAAAIAALKRRVDDKASVDDLPYELVEIGEWEFSGSVMQSGVVYGVDESESAGDWIYTLTAGQENINDYSSPEKLDSVSFSVGVTATRNVLHDRAVNAVEVTGAITLTLPALVTGKSRDLIVRLTVSADAAVTFSAPSGETVTWDDAGSPTATYEAGNYLLRFTEVAQGVFHFTDLGDGGSIDPAVLNGKLESTSAAPAFDPTKTYSVGEHVTYEGVLYECSTAVTTAGVWTGSTNWTATDMTTPDATLDLMADGRLRLVSADGDVLWMQGYGLASASSVTLSCDRVNFHAFAAAPAFDATSAYAANDIVAYDGVVYVFTAAHAAGAWTGSDASVYAVALAMPTAPSGKVGDFVLDVDNTANASASVTATLTGAGTAFDVFTREGVNLSTDILTFAGGEQCELYFTMTAFGTAAKPAWNVVKQVVEKQEFGS